MASNFPEELLSEIQLRLSVKSLLRFMCVKKSWASLVSDPNFAKLHFDRTAPHDHELLLDVLPREFCVKLLDLEGSLEEHSMDLVFPILWSPIFDDEFNIDIIGVRRGFILFAHYTPPVTRYWTPSAFFVSNPATGVNRTISFYPSFSPALSGIVGSDEYHYNIRYSFEYDALRDDYYIVIAMSEVCRGFFNEFFCLNSVVFFSMRTNSWTQVGIPGIPCERRSESPCISFVNGAMHWLNVTEYAVYVGIIAFDFIEGNISNIPLPHDGFYTDGYDTKLRLEVIGGCVCLSYGSRVQPGFAELWMLKECEGKSSWTKFNYMAACAVPRCCFTPIYFTKGGEIVGLDGKDLSIVKLNDKGEVLCCDDSLVFRQQLGTYMYTRSLLSLPSDSLQP